MLQSQVSGIRNLGMLQVFCAYLKITDMEPVTKRASGCSQDGGTTEEIRLQLFQLNSDLVKLWTYMQINRSRI